MRALLLFTAFLLFGSCVPFSEYRLSMDQHKELSLQADSKNNELKILKKNNEALSKKIAQVEKQLAHEEKIKYDKEAQINKRLKKSGIKSNLSASDIYDLNIHQPYYGENYYRVFMKLNPCRNPDTARNFSWLTEKEKDTYYWLNYARIYPKEFCDSFVRPFLSNPGSDKDPYLLSLIDYLYAMKPLNALVPDKKLHEAAGCHATNIGKNEIDESKRFEGCSGLKFPECRDYGNYTARAHVIRLLLSKNKPDLQNRYNCLDFFYSAGISFANDTKKETVLLAYFFSKEPR